MPPEVFAATGTFRRIAASIAGLCLLGALAACTTAPLRPPVQAGAGHALAVIPLHNVPGSDFGGRTYSEILAQDAKPFSGNRTAGLLALVIATIAFPPLGAELGMALGQEMRAARAPASAAYGIPEEHRAALDRALSGALADLPLPELTANAVVRSIATFTSVRAEVTGRPAAAAKDTPPDYQPLRNLGFGGALEVMITRTGFAAAMGDGVFLFVTAEARLIDTQTGKPTWLRGLVYESPAHDANRWLRDDAALTRVELERAYRRLGERIVDVLLLATSADSMPVPATCGVALLDPQRAAAGGLPGPVLGWTAVPPHGHSLGSDPWAGAKDLRYDLRIWNTVDNAPGDIVYERLGLGETRHQVEVALEPAAGYFWSVRVRGTVDGHARAAPWTGLTDPQFFYNPIFSKARFHAEATGNDELPRPVSCGGSWAWCDCVDFIPVANFYQFRAP